MSYKCNLVNKDELGKITPEDSLSVDVDSVSSSHRAHSKYDIDSPFSGRYNEEEDRENID
jgi:hypothetical protein